MEHFKKNLNKIFVYLWRYRLLVLSLLLTIAVSFFSINLALMALSLFIVYKISLKVISGKIVNSHTFMAVISVFFYTLMLQGVSLVTWLLSPDFPLSLNIFVTLVTVAAIYFPIRPKNVSTNISRIALSDIVSIGVVIATLIVFVAIPIKNTNLSNESALVVLANYNVDDASHLGLINIRLQNNVATTSGNSAEASVNNGVSYPSGWPATNAAIIQAFNPPIQTGSDTLTAYVLIKIFWLLLLVFVFTRVIFTMYSIFSKKSLQLAGVVWIGLGSFIFTAWFLVDSFFFGFFSYLPQLITIPLFILSIMQLASMRKKDGDLLSYLMLPVSLGVGAALSWFLLFPVFMFVILLCLINRTAKNGLRTVSKELFMNILKYIVFYLVTFAALFAQVSMILNSSESGVSTTFIQSLLLNGGISTYPVGFYMLILIGLVLFITFSNIKNNLDKFGAVLNYVIAMLGFATFVYLLQQYMVFGNLYYYFKILNSVTVVGIIFAITGIAITINILQLKTSRYIAVVLAITISFLVLQFAYPNAPLAVYAKAKRSVSASANQQIFDILENDATQSNYNNGVVTIFYPQGNPILNEVASTLVQSNKPYNTCYTGLKNASFKIPLIDFDPEVISKYCTTGNHIVYYVEQPYLRSVKNKIVQQGLSSQVTVLALAN